MRLIGANGEAIGIVSATEALASAEEAGLDLVEISPNAEPPVCRIMDYNKFQYQQDKAKKKQRQMHLKEIRLRPSTEEDAYQVKLRNLTRFLTDGDKVKVSIRFRGREAAHPELGMQILERMQIDLTNCGTVEQAPKMEGRQIVMVVNPKKK